MSLPNTIKFETLLELFKKNFPKAKDPNELVSALEQITLFNIDNTKRVAMFLAQCAHESMGFKVFSENLNYSAAALNLVFPKYFKNAGRDANQFARKPEKIANVVYANRMGNGPSTSGDGWKYRGRGLIQLTGKNNYIHFANEMECPDVLDNPDLVSTDMNLAVKSAVWFWIKHNLNDYADADDIKGCTKIINGGYNGLEERTSIYQKLKSVISETIPDFD